MAIKYKPYSEITVESGTQLKTVYICSVVSAHLDFHEYISHLEASLV